MFNITKRLGVRGVVLWLSLILVSPSYGLDWNRGQFMGVAAAVLATVGLGALLLGSKNDTKAEVIRADGNAVEQEEDEEVVVSTIINAPKVSIVARSISIGGLRLAARPAHLHQLPEVANTEYYWISNDGSKPIILVNLHVTGAAADSVSISTANSDDFTVHTFETLEGITNKSAHPTLPANGRWLVKLHRPELKAGEEQLRVGLSFAVMIGKQAWDITLTLAPELP